jgi:hypothetical protein
MVLGVGQDTRVHYIICSYSRDMLIPSLLLLPQPNVLKLHFLLSHAEIGNC